MLLQLVNGESAAAVASVMIGGRLILDGGRVLTVDEARVRGAAEKAIARLLEANAASLAFARSLENAVGDFSIARGREVHGLGACCRQRTASVPRGHAPVESP